MKFEDVFNLIIPDCFGCNDDNDETASMEEVYSQLDETVSTSYGVSQFVIIFDDNNDKVVKIPFSGEWSYNEEDEDYYFDDFSINYTDLSVEIYNRAEEAGISPIFAKVEYIGDSKNGYPLYAQDKVKFSFGSIAYKEEKPYKLPLEETLTIVRNCYKTDFYSYAWRAFTETWTACAIEYYGFDLVDRFMKFLDDNGIDDLHQNNYGFTAEGRPVIYDYCGFDY